MHQGKFLYSKSLDLFRRTLRGTSITLRFNTNDRLPTMGSQARFVNYLVIPKSGQVTERSRIHKGNKKYMNMYIKRHYTHSVPPSGIGVCTGADSRTTSFINFPSRIRKTSKISAAIKA